MNSKVNKGRTGQERKHTSNVMTVKSCQTLRKYEFMFIVIFQSCFCKKQTFSDQ